MPARRILELGDPMLREVSREVRRTEDARLIVRDLRATLRAFRKARGFGRGISAVQIGEPKRIIYLELDGQLAEVADARTGKFETVLHPAVHRIVAARECWTAVALINPTFDWLSQEKFRLWDDCFSFPDLMVWVERSVSVRLRYQDSSGQRQAIECSGALSELVQHEMDHLDGILAVDRAIDKSSFCTREEYRRRFAGRERQGKTGTISGSFVENK